MTKKTFRGDIFLYYITLFILFTIVVVVFQYQREKSYRTSQLENTLDNITEITYRFIIQNQLLEKNNIDRINEIQSMIPQTNARITIIDKKGKVLFDSSVEKYNLMENHLQRPEIQEAVHHNIGSNIRTSTTTKQEYYYYAKQYPAFFIRTALVYNVEVQNFLKANLFYLLFIFIVFIFVGVVLFLVTLKLSDAITKLKDFAVKAGNNETIAFNTKFPENELGVIGSQIIQIYYNLKKTKDELYNEKEKLFNHLNALNEGIAFFSSEKQNTLCNSHFIQNINLISNKKILHPNDIFEIDVFKKLNLFLNDYLTEGLTFDIENLPQINYIVSKSEKYFKIQSIIFFDKSFEVMIFDITRLEKRRLLKQQLTSNIAHELKTPLASIKGYLETILDNWPIPEEKHKYFLNKAYDQSERLNELINDVSLLNNIEDAGDLFSFKPTGIKKIITEVYENFANRLEDKNIALSNEVKESTVINGNVSLLFSIFQNLIDNSIKYGGKKIHITIKDYHEDEKYVYFLYNDTGPGIPEEHLPRIFERFYRIDYGRTREMGGTGLGLAIVKNAVQLHKGEISVKNNPAGGTVFLFSLSKK